MRLLYYLLEANLYLLIFYGFYRLFLYQETYYKINRYYLILATITAFFLPLLVANGAHETMQTSLPSQVFPGPVVNGEMAIPAPPEAPGLLAQAMLLLPGIYLLAVAFFMIKLLISIAGIARIAYSGKREKAGRITIISLEKHQDQAFSFFNFLFINPSLSGKQTVINHELAHIQQRHSYDILFFEIVRAACWFNPVAWFMKNDVKLLHEYLADESTITFSNDKHAYAMYLIEHSFGLPSNQITNHIFNQSILKRRINMLNKERSTGRARLKLLLLLPLTCAMAGVSTMAFTKDYGFIDVYPEKYSSMNNNLSAQQTQQQVPPPPPQEPPAPKNKNLVVSTFVKEGPGNYQPVVYFNKIKKTYTNYDRRLVVINGKKVDKTYTIGGIKNATAIKYLTKTEAIKKYGDAGRFGAVELKGTGIDIVRLNNFTFPPPIIKPNPPKTDVVRFPPPSIASEFYKYFRVDSKTGKGIPVDKRVVFINGVAQKEFYGATGITKKTFLTPASAIKKYGNIGRYGAVELTGDTIKVLGMVETPPPPMEPKSTQEKAGKTNDDKIYDYVSIETPPTYPGGLDAFRLFLKNNIKYPVEASKNKIQGVVYVTYTVEKDGSLTDIRVERKLGSGLDEEAIRVVRLSKKWIPGIQNGKPVRVKYNIPVKFALK